jgi:hypothetical protein
LTRRYQQMLALNPQRECSGCSHRPNCGGGCIAAQWIALDRPEGVNCEHSYFESVKQDAAIRGFLLATSDTTDDALTHFPPSIATAPMAGASSRPGPKRPAALRVVTA